MVEARLKLEPEVQKIFSLMDAKENFLLSGGAGSGKTYSLVQVIRQAIAENPSAKIACMTYTNAAVREIEERVNHKNLNVTTIHDFLWDNIKHFQKELKAALVILCNDEAVTQFIIDEPSPLLNDYFDLCKYGIQYKEFVRLKEGIISHDEVLIIASYLFQSYPKLSDIVKDKYSFIFIDEYQDTSKSVVDIFLTHFDLSGKQNIIGFFGDAMQSIYDDTIGNLNDYMDKVKEIKKEQNRRNPKRVIDLANRLRTDGIVQVSSVDNNAPNMQNGVLKEGNVLFLYSDNGDISRVKNFLSNQYGWHFTNAKESKELNLTHNLIADKAGFRMLMDIYNRDLIINYRDRIKKYIKDNSIATDFSANTFGEVVEILKQEKTGAALNAVLPTSGMNTFIQNNQGLFSEALNYNYADFSRMYINKDQLLDDKKKDEADENKKGSKRDDLIKHLFKIQTNIFLYQNRLFNEFLRVTDYRYRILSIADKKVLKENVESLIDVGNKTIEEIITDADTKGICIIDDKLNDFIENKTYLYNRVKDVRFSEFQFLYDYLEGKTPFSTQHKTKGTEFDNVLVILDNGGWRNYNFENLFLGTGTGSVLNRTQKIFYVCCTRAKEKLAVFYHHPSAAVIAKAGEWFGADSVKEVN